MKWLKNFSLKALFYNKKFAVSFSVIVAFIFWLVITIDQNPERDMTFNNVPVSISVSGTVLEDLGIDVVSKDVVQTVSVTVHGPNYIVSALKSDDIVVNASVSHIVEPGVYSINLVASRNSGKSGYNFVSVSPSAVSLTFDYIDTKDFTVTAQAEGVSAVAGLIAETPVISSSDESTVKIKGPRTEIEKISKVCAVVDDVTILSATKSFNGKIVLYDANNNILDDKLLTFSKETVSVSVPIFKKATVRIVPSFINAPANFSLSSIVYTLDQDPSITIKGPADIVDVLDSISLSPIDFNEISTKKTTFETAPVLPDGIKLVDNIENVTVSFNLSGYIEKSFDITDVRLNNLSGGLTADCQKIRNVKICGPRSIVNSISASDLYATVDLTGKTVGEYSMVANISSSVSGVWSVGSYNASVTVK